MNCASLPNLDSAANPPDTNKGVRTTSWQDSSARPGASQTPRHKLGRATPCGSTALWRTYVPQHFLCRISFADNRTGARKSARTRKGGIFEHFLRRQSGHTSDSYKGYAIIPPFYNMNSTHTHKRITRIQHVELYDAYPLSSLIDIFSHNGIRISCYALKRQGASLYPHYGNKVRPPSRSLGTPNL